MEEKLQLKNGHYEIALPWKTYSLNLVNKRSVAECHLSLLKKQLQREPLVHEKYTDFMDGLLKKDYARKVNCQDRITRYSLVPLLSPSVSPEKAR